MRIKRTVTVEEYLDLPVFLHFCGTYQAIVEYPNDTLMRFGEAGSYDAINYACAEQMVRHAKTVTREAFLAAVDRNIQDEKKRHALFMQRMERMQSVLSCRT